MNDPERKDELRATRAKLAKVIRRRPKVRPLVAVVMSVLFAGLVTPVVAVDLILASTGVVTFVPGEPAPLTVRVPRFSGFSDDRFELSHGSVVVARGQMVDRRTAEVVQAVRDHAPAPGPALAGYFAILLTLGLLYTTYLGRSHRGHLLRTQAVTLLLVVGGALLVEAALLFTSMSVFLVPLAALALVAAAVVDVSVGLTTGLLASVLVGLLVPFDLGVIAVLLLQTTTACLVAGDRRPKNTRVVGAGLAGGACAAMAYTVLCYLATGQSPFGELVDPLRSGLGAAMVGGVLGGLLAIPLKPLYQFLLGDITKSKLVELEDLSNPMLRQIAENSPGTWQHSLAMANMAEIAANAIGADGRLVRVGAYYHDLGKSLQPKYFIENLEPGESSPHDRLPPEVSCDAIFAHVTEGIRVARKHGLPERIIDFMYMHHGDGLLEYFWAKCRESGNPKSLTEDDFRYPGVPPQSRETAILAICDAVEAASRTLKKPDERAIENLVQRIVYGKLHLGQLDQSGLSMSDLRKISNSLRETIKHAHHGRIEYPWQREEKQAQAQAQAQAQTDTDTQAEKPDTSATRIPVSATQRIIHEPRLDSLDAPRPYYWVERVRTKARPFETAPTERLEVESDTGNGNDNETHASHSSLPVEIEAVTDEDEDPTSAPTMPLMMSESQSLVAPSSADDPDEADEASGEAVEPAPRPAGEVQVQEPQAAETRAEAPEGSVPDEARARRAPAGPAVPDPVQDEPSQAADRARDKSKSGTKLGFPGAGQPEPGPGPLSSADTGPDAGDATPDATEEPPTPARRSSGRFK